MWKLSLNTQILVGMFMGLFCGLFFGEMMVAFEPLGQAFIMLLKMTIIPYVSFSLIHAIGSLSQGGAWRLFSRALCFFALMWTATILTVFVFGALFPEQNVPIFYSSLVGNELEQESLLKIFIPTNPINALANDAIPAVVTFSLFFGMALIQLQEKANFLDNVYVVIQVLTRITKWITLLSPIGVFSLIAAAIGSMPFHELQKIELYLMAYFLAIFFLCLFLFPLAVHTLTPVGARQFLNELKPAMLLSFTTGNVLVSLPYVIQGLEKLTKEALDVEQEEKAKHTIESMVPLAYNFPTVGNLFAILFILFLGYFYAQPISFTENLRLIGLALPALFGPANSVINGIAFLIDKMHFPVDGKGLFIETLPMTRNLQAFGASTGIAFVSFLTAIACVGKIRFSGKAVFKSSALSLFVILTMVGGGKLVVGEPVESNQERYADYSLRSPVDAEVFTDPPYLVEPRMGPLLESIIESGILRIGYNAANMPFAFFNAKGELVGFDIALAHQLARDLGVSLQFIPFDYETLEEKLNNGEFDIALSSLSVTPERMRAMGFTTPYLRVERALIVRDHRRWEFSDTEAVAKDKNFSLCVVSGTSFEEIAPSLFPKATIIPIESDLAFVQETPGDALLWTKEEGTTWSLIHPAYTVVIPAPSIGEEYYVMATAKEETEWLQWVEYWLQLQTMNGFTEKQYDYWILGKRPDDQPRWSIARDVLHWVN